MCISFAHFVPFTLSPFRAGSTENQKFLAIAYFDGTISILETKTYKVIRVLKARFFVDGEKRKGRRNVHCFVQLRFTAKLTTIQKKKMLLNLLG